jgi:hypothetical protein
VTLIQVPNLANILRWECWAVAGCCLEGCCLGCTGRLGLGLGLRWGHFKAHPVYLLSFTLPTGLVTPMEAPSQFRAPLGWPSPGPGPPAWAELCCARLTITVPAPEATVQPKPGSAGQDRLPGLGLEHHRLRTWAWAWLAGAQATTEVVSRGWTMALHQCLWCLCLVGCSVSTPVLVPVIQLSGAGVQIP